MGLCLYTQRKSKIQLFDLRWVLQMSSILKENNMFMKGKNVIFLILSSSILRIFERMIEMLQSHPADRLPTERIPLGMETYL